MLVLYSLADRTWKIADFGLTSEGTARARTTGIRNNRGTIGYRAPELLQDDNGRYSNKSDIWAVGCIFYELIFQQKRFFGDLEVVGYSGNEIFDIPSDFDLISDENQLETVR